MNNANDYMETLAATLASQTRMIRRPEVQKILGGVPTSTLYYWMSTGRLARPHRIGARAVAWPAAELANFLRNCKAA